MTGKDKKTTDFCTIKVRRGKEETETGENRGDINKTRNEMMENKSNIIDRLGSSLARLCREQQEGERKKEENKATGK